MEPKSRPMDGGPAPDDDAEVATDPLLVAAVADGCEDEGQVVAALVRAAAGGDQSAWDALVARFTRLVWAVARSFRLSEHDAADVVQTTWLRLVEHLDAVREPERVGAWLGTTARREALRVARARGVSAERGVDLDLTALPDPAPALEEALLTRERDAELYRAVLRLNERCQQVLRVLSASPPPRYEVVSQVLGLPVGSIGPTRARCLAQLRRQLVAQGWLDGGLADSGAGVGAR